jgi:hypothetical protein
MHEIQEPPPLEFRNRIAEDLFPLEFYAEKVSIGIRDTEEIETGGEIPLQFLCLFAQFRSVFFRG